MGTGRVRYTPDPYTERFVKRMGSPDATTGRARSAPDPYSESTTNSLLMPSHTGRMNRVLPLSSAQCSMLDPNIASH